MPYYFTVFIHYCQRLLYDNDPVHSSPYCFTVLIHQFQGLLYDQPSRSSEAERNPKTNLLQLFHSWGRGVHLQVDRKSVRFTDSGWLSTTAASGQKCHIDLRFQLFHSWGGGGGTSAGRSETCKVYR